VQNIALDNDFTEWLDIATLAPTSELSDGIIIDSAATRTVLERVARVAPYPATVLIYGESGTGKELIARRLHAMGPRPRGPYVVFNCSNLMDTLAESQLFGHTKGSFTGARHDAPGYFRAAEGGTLFLDEIGELPLSLQPKLLRVLEDRAIQAVGSPESHHIDVRVIAATNRDIPAMVARGEFRADLYYRLGSTSVTLPPLRERAGAVAVLSASFIRDAMRAFSVNSAMISRGALDVLRAYEWPGNVRELKHAIEHAMMTSAAGCIDVDSLPDYLHPHDASPVQLVTEAPAPDSDLDAGGDSFGCSKDGMLQHAVEDAVRRALHAAGGHRSETARSLGISRSTLYRWMSRMGVAESHAQ
jgi:transcriptional regulator with PAS, ATPase and Fis domain